jgi:hypothetical protein
MTDNKVFIRSLYCLLHPLSLAAMLLLVVNGHWFQPRYPSWLTGKIGDFVWLVFAPFLCASVVSWCFPYRLKDRPKVAFGLSLLIIGLWFVFGKTVPVVNEITRNAWSFIIGKQGILLIDLSDLLALPGLFVSCYIWQQISDTSAKVLTRYGVILIIAALASVAYQDSGYAFSFKREGVATICKTGTQLTIDEIVGVSYAPADHQGGSSKRKLITNRFTSSNGGITWSQPIQIEVNDTAYNTGIPEYHPECSLQTTQQLTDPQNGLIHYRWQPGQTIEYSVDSGQSWALDRDLFELRQGMRLYRPPSQEYGEDGFIVNDASPGPKSGLVDPETGNVLFAMGWYGVLVKTPEGLWHWADVGSYRLKPLPDLPSMYRLFPFEVLFSGILFILVLTIGVNMQRPPSAQKDLVQFTNGAGILGWIIGTLVFLPLQYVNGGATQQDLIIPIIFFFTPSVAGFCITVRQLKKAITDKARIIYPVYMAGVAVGIIYLLPYFLWAQGIIEDYNSAAVLAVILAIMIFLASYLIWRKLHFLKNSNSG